MVQLFQIFGVSLFLWGIAIAALFLGSFVYFFRGKEKDEIKERSIMFGFAGLFLFLGISWIFFILTYTLNDELFYLVGGLVKSDNDFAYFLYIILGKLGFIFSIGSIFLLVYPIEKNVIKSKYILTITNILFLVGIIISPLEYQTYLYGLIQYFDILIVYIILIRLVKVTESEFKSIITLLIIGFMLIICGFLLYGAFLLHLNDSFYILSPLIVTLGTLISIIPVMVNPKTRSNIHRLWIILGFIPIALGIYLAINFIYFIDILSLTVLFNGIIILIFLSLAFYQIIIIIKTEQESALAIPLNVLDMFTKPPSFTEEDAIFNKEKQLCLVCKSQIIGYTYICRHCKALYCSKCSISLSNLENSCWVCNNPIDDSKPIEDINEKEKIANSHKGKKMVKFFSNRRMLKHIFDDNLSPEELRSLEIIKLTIILEEELDKIEKLGLKEKEQEKFIEEVVHFPPNERKLILDDISEKLNSGGK